MSKYDVDDVEKTVKEEILKDIASHVKSVRKLDEANPHEQAIKFNEIKQNPPDPDFMKVEVFHGKDENGNDLVYSESKGPDGETRRIDHNPIMRFSPYIGFMANIAKCPMNVGDMLIDQAMNMVYEEKKAFHPEKRKQEFNIWWILFIVLIAIPIAVFILGFMLS